MRALATTFQRSHHAALANRLFAEILQDLLWPGQGVDVHVLGLDFAADLVERL